MSATARGPNRSSLAALADVLGDDDLFATLDDGWRSIQVTQKDLAKHLGIEARALSKRIGTLRDMELARGRGVGLRFDAEGIAATIAGKRPRPPGAQVLSLRAHAAKTGRAPSTEHYHRQRTGELRTVDGAPVTPGSVTELDAAVAAWLEVATIAATQGDRALMRTAEIAVCGLAKVAVCLAQQTAIPRAANGDRVALCSRGFGLKTNDDDENHVMSCIEGSRAANGDSRAANGDSPSPQTETVDNHSESHSLADLAALARPLSDVIAERGAAPVDWNHRLVTAARRRTRTELEAAVAGVVANEFAIDNLAGAFYRTVVDGWDRWLSTPGPSPWDDPAPAPAIEADEPRPVVVPAEADDWSGWIACFRAYFAGHERDPDLHTLAAGAIALLPTDPDLELEHIAVLLDEGCRMLREYGRQRDFNTIAARLLVEMHDWEIDPDSVVRSCYPRVA